MMDPASWKAAKAVLFEALQRPEAERELFVRERCEDDAVRAEILSLIRDCPTSDDFLASHPELGDLEEQDELSDLKPGTQLGHYVILDRLGRGGMGQVFLANDQQLRRKVALKCLLSSSRGPAAERTRILREARAAAAINHPNVATIYQVVEQGDRAFIEMEYVEGESLAARLKRERLPIDRVVAIGCQLAAALAAAHSRNIVHRDLKPANIQITPDGSAKVLDFGVAGIFASFSPASSGNSTTSRSGVKAFMGGGTPPYMSPEQLLGRRVDDRSDIYSLGVVLFEMVTGRRPYTTTDPLGLVQEQAKGAPRTDVADRKVPRALADVIAKTLESDVDQRYQSATEVETALRSLYLERKGPWEEAEPIWVKPARVALGIVLGALLVGSIGVVATVGFNQTFGRTGGFARFGVEPWHAYFEWGVLAVFPSIVIMVLTTIIVAAARFLLGAMELIGPIGQISGRLRTRARQAATSVGLDKPAVLAQALTVLAVLGLLALYLLYADLIYAWAAFFNTAPIETLLPMGPKNFARLRFKVALDVMTLTFCFGLFKVVQLRSRQNTRDGTLVIGLLASIVTIFILMNGWSYRILSQRDFERVFLGNARCYITGQTSDQFLVLCPASAPPRNRAVRSDDPNLVRTGVIENVFEGVSSPKTGS